MTEAMHQLSCQELVELVTDYLEGALPEDERRRFDEHVDGCEGCRTYVDQMRATLEVAGELSPESLDPETEQTLLTTFRSWSKT